MLPRNRFGDPEIAGWANIIRLKRRESIAKVVARDCADDKHPICERPILFARVQFRNPSIGGLNI